MSEDGVHFKECGDAIMPRSSRCHIASGSAMVDENNFAGKGKGTVIAAYTDLCTTQYHGRPAIWKAVGQMLMYSTDGGITFNYFYDEPIIPGNDGERWRDPKIFALEDNTLCIAVYETFEKRTA